MEENPNKKDYNNPLNYVPVESARKIARPTLALLISGELYSDFVKQVCNIKIEPGLTLDPTKAYIHLVFNKV